MKNKQSVSRRDFIKGSVMAGGAMLLAGVLPVKAAALAADDSGDYELTPDDGLLKGVSDIHLHAAPDSKARLGNELEFARAACKAGYKSMLFKSNDFNCHHATIQSYNHATNPCRHPQITDVIMASFRNHQMNRIFAFIGEHL